MKMKVDVTGFANVEIGNMEFPKGIVIHGTQENSNEPVMVCIDHDAARDLLDFLQANTDVVPKATPKKGGK